MARGGYNTKLPNKISFFKEDRSKLPYSLNKDTVFYGPYMKKPTAAFKDSVGEFIEFEMDKEGNYIRKNGK